MQNMSSKLMIFLAFWALNEVSVGNLMISLLYLASFFYLVVVHNFLKADLEDDDEEVEVSSVWKALNRINSTKHELPISAISYPFVRRHLKMVLF